MAQPKDDLFHLKIQPNLPKIAKFRHFFGLQNFWGFSSPKKCLIFVNFRANLVKTLNIEFEVRKVISCCATLEQSDNISVKTLNIVKIYEKLELSMSKPLSGQGRFSDSFEIFETLGKGAFSIVKRCRSKEGHNKGKDFAHNMINHTSNLNKRPTNNQK